MTIVRIFKGKTVISLFRFDDDVIAVRLSYLTEREIELSREKERGDG